MVTKFGVIGTGPWGIKVAAAIRSLRYYCISCSGRDADIPALIGESDIVFIAAHPSVHIALAQLAMESGKPVIVEKPVGFNATEVRELLLLSRALQVPFIVDYIHLFNDGVMNLKYEDLTKMSIELGGPGPARDYSPLWDYGSHAVAVALSFTQKPLTRIETIVNGSQFVLHFGYFKAEISVSNSLQERVARFKSTGYAENIYEDNQQHRPLESLISIVAQLHLTGQYWTNGDLAVRVTDLLERMHK